MDWLELGRRFCVLPLVIGDGREKRKKRYRY